MTNALFKDKLLKVQNDTFNLRSYEVGIWKGGGIVVKI